MMSEDGLKKLLDEMVPSDREYPTPAENTLRHQIRAAFEGKQQEWVDDYLISEFADEDMVIKWMSEHAPQFTLEALETPAVIDDSEEFIEALTGVGNMVPWEKVDPEVLDDNDYGRWQDWDNARRSAEQEAHDERMQDEF